MILQESPWFRDLRVIAAVWYGLVATPFVPTVIDAVLPSAKTIAAADFPCAHHDCGCKTAEQCRLHCCCHPTAKPQARTASCHLHHHEQPVTVRISYVSAARCAGHLPTEGQVVASHLDSHLPLATLSLVPPLRSCRHPMSVAMHPHAVFQDPPDKIPIARLLATV